MNAVEKILSSELVQALGWTILHSLWQGAIVALLLAFTLILLRQNSSKVRYFVASASLFTMFFVSLITFFSLYQNAAEQKKIQSEIVALPDFEQSQTTVLAAEKQSSEASWADYNAFFSDYFDQHLPLIVSLWLLGVIILMLRFLGGVAYLQRLKHYRVKPVSDFWQGTTNFLATQIKLRKPVKLLESAMVQVPMVIGFLKPVILLPVGTLTGLSQQQVESILAHELAHVYRNDYLLNVLQSLVEIILFFNPFIWWISASIREERENCCDDIAISVTGDQLAFVKTLATLEEMRLYKPELALAITGKKGGLLNRVNRILTQKNTDSTFSEGFLAAFVLVFCLAIASINANAQYSLTLNSLNPFRHLELMKEVSQIQADKLVALAPKPEQESKEKVKELLKDDIKDLKEEKIKKLAMGDTIRFGEYMIVTDRYGKAEIFKNGTKIPKEEYDKYKGIFEVKPGKDKNDFGYAYSYDDEDGFVFVPIAPIPPLPTVPPPFSFNFNFNDEPGFFMWSEGDKKYKINYDKNGNIEELYINDKKISPKDYKKHDKVIKEWEKRKMDRKGGFYFGNKEEWENWGKNWERWGEQFGKNWENWGENIGKQYKDRYHNEDEMRDRMKSQQERMKEQMERQEERIEEQEKRMKEQNEKMKEQQKKQEELLNELKKDGLLEKDAKNISIKVRQNSIRVNGKNLEGEEYEKYKKYFREKMGINVEGDDNWSWNWNDD